MNCLEYRRQLAADPRRESPEMLEHRRECPGCAAHHARALGFELQLRRSLTVPAPDGLAERILLAQATAERRDRGSQRRYLGWAMTAAVLLVVAVGVIGLSPGPAFADAMVEHMQREPESFVSRLAMPESEVLRRFTQRGVKLAGPLPPGISYASPCPVGSYLSVHMVMPQEEGPITVIYIAHHREGARDDFRKADVVGRSVPMADGTLVMMAANGARFDALESAWRQSLEGAADQVAGAR
ncbi:MAG TPA: DUF3379 family protein [Tahibacter sp.]|nr:DUF3379 family protein [Tahibacter sp.]